MSCIQTSFGAVVTDPVPGLGQFLAIPAGGKASNKRFASFEEAGEYICKWGETLPPADLARARAFADACNAADFVGGVRHVDGLVALG